MKEINIGKKIAEFRNQQNLTIKELSEKSQVTASMLSQLERGLTNPSINTLKSIAQALDVQLFTFFLEDEKNANLVQKKGSRRQVILPSETQNIITYELLSPDLNGDIELAIMTLEPDSHTSKDNFKHIGEEVAYVSEGSVHIFINDQEMQLETGDSIKIPPNTLHRWYNPYDKNAVVIFAVSPASF